MSKITNDQPSLRKPNGQPRKGRGAISNPDNRFSLIRTVQEDDGWHAPVEEASLVTDVRPEYAKTVITRNASPDVPFDQSLNPYRGCEHGCIYCFARPTHAYWDLSPGLDFETRLFYKANAAEVLARQLSAPRYQCRPLVLGTSTDPYQPIEKFYGITRQILETLDAYHHPVSLITKGALIERDVDLLAAMAERRLCSVMVSVTTLNNDLKRTLEPRAASPEARLRAIRTLTSAGVPVGILMAPIIPMINDMEIEALLERCREAGAETANFVFLRLPLEVRELFHEWLHAHYPERAEHVISLIRQSREGRDYQAEFGTRMRGTGVYAELIRRRFELACKKLGFDSREKRQLNCGAFRVPGTDNSQLSLF